jgi:hypothetical protein
MICLDELLTGTPTWEQVVGFWRDGEFCGEEYLVQAIEKWLQTEEQRKRMFDARLSIEKMLNGRFTADVEKDVDAIFAEWNAKLGFKAFGV